MRRVAAAGGEREGEGGSALEKYTSNLNRMAQDGRIDWARASLGARFVLDGSVRKAGDRVRVTVQLIDAAADVHVWAERYDRELADIFAVQDEITDAIVAAIEPQLYAAENFRAQQKPPGSLDAAQRSSLKRARAKLGIAS